MRLIALSFIAALIAAPAASQCITSKGVFNQYKRSLA